MCRTPQAAQRVFDFMCQTADQIPGRQLLRVLLLLLTDAFLLVNLAQFDQRHLFLIVIDSNDTDFDTARFAFDHQGDLVIGKTLSLGQAMA